MFTDTTSASIRAIRVIRVLLHSTRMTRIKRMFTDNTSASIRIIRVIRVLLHSTRMTRIKRIFTETSSASIRAISVIRVLLEKKGFAMRIFLRSIVLFGIISGVMLSQNKFCIGKRRTYCHSGRKTDPPSRHQHRQLASARRVYVQVQTDKFSSAH